MTDTPVVDQRMDLPTLTVRDRLANLDTSAISKVVKHDLGRLLSDVIPWYEMFGVRLEELSESPTFSPRIREVMEQNAEATQVFHKIQRAHEEQNRLRDLRKLAAIDHPDAISGQESVEEYVVDISSQEDIELTQDMLDRHLPGYLGNRATEDIVEKGDLTLAEDIIDVALDVPNDQSEFLSEDQVRQQKEPIRTARALLPVFAQGAQFLKDPSTERLDQLIVQRIPIEQLVAFFKKDINYQGDHTVVLNGAEVIILDGLINNAIDHGSNRVVEVIREGKYHTIRVVNESKEPLTEEQLKPGVTSKVDTNGVKKSDSGYGLVSVKTLAEAAGLQFSFESKILENNNHQVTTYFSDKPQVE